MTTATLATSIDATAEALAEMMTENTGRHMLDSGGESGRAWQRNQGMTAEDFLARPRVYLDDFEGYPVVDLFHFLNERLTFNPDLTQAWNDFDATMPEASWNESLMEWLETLGVPVNEDSEFYSDGAWEFNTYNFDGCTLNGTIQGVKFVIAGTEYLALQIHGGADVRGGYTKYKIFSGDVESIVVDSCSAYLSCPDCDFYASYSHGALEDFYLPKSESKPDMLIEVDAETDMPEGWQAVDGCPLHKIELV